MTIEIREIEFAGPLYRKTLELRYEILRKPIGMELRDKDVALDGMEHHIAAMDGGNVVGCVLLRPLDADHVKLRQMAVADTYQGKGLGAELVRFAERLAVTKQFKTIETNARKTARGFYEKLGYRAIGEEFIEVSVHTVKMQKALLLR